MKIILHIGLHKTGSTYLQTLFQQTARLFRPRGIFYQANSHHSIAWAVLRGDFAPLQQVIREARTACCETVVISAEDFENLLLDTAAARALEASLFEIGVTEIDWVICIRSQDEYFWSLYSQMSRHVYLDPFSMFYQVMLNGCLRVPTAQPEAGLAYWIFCFDYARFIPIFAEAIRGRLLIDDFAQRSPFPLYKLFEFLGIADTLSPEILAVSRNERLPKRDIATGYETQFVQALSERGRGEFAGTISARAQVDPHLQTLMSTQIAERYCSSNDRVLKQFPFQIPLA